MDSWGTSVGRDWQTVIYLLGQTMHITTGLLPRDMRRL